MFQKISHLILPLVFIACDPSSGTSLFGKDNVNGNNDNTAGINGLDEDTALDTAEESENSEISPTLETLSQDGAYSYSEEDSSLSVASCSAGISYTHVQSSRANAPTVFLSHGFARSSSNMIEWAHHWATWGFDVIVVDSCHFADHAQNGQGLVELAEGLNISSPIFAGQSAGGLASFVAGSSVPNALGVLGLDATDDMSTTGASVGSQVSVPVLGLVGEPSLCNSQNNGIGMLEAASNSTLLRVIDADHCDFESPTDGGCTGFCENSAAAISDEEIHETILILSTAGLLWLSNGSSEASDLWTGSQKQELIDSGAIEEIE